MTFAPTVKKLVTRPVLKFEKDKTLYVRILAAMYAGSPPKQRAGSTRTPVAPTFAAVITLDNKAESTLPIHPKLKDALTASYPDDSYVGKCFAITAKTRQAGVQFTPFHLAEIEDPDAAPAPDSSAGEDSRPSTLHASGRRR